MNPLLKVNEYGVRWIKIKSSQSSHHERSSGNSSQSVPHGEVDGGNDFAER